MALKNAFQTYISKNIYTLKLIHASIARETVIGVSINWKISTFNKLILNNYNRQGYAGGTKAALNLWREGGTARYLSDSCRAAWSPSCGLLAYPQLMFKTGKQRRKQTKTKTKQKNKVEQRSLVNDEGSNDMCFLQGSSFL